jgi:hypothetical protein
MSEQPLTEQELAAFEQSTSRLVAEVRRLRAALQQVAAYRDHCDANDPVAWATGMEQVARAALFAAEAGPPILDESMNALELGVRGWNCIVSRFHDRAPRGCLQWRSDVSQRVLVRDLVQLRAEDLLGIRGFGPKSLAVVRMALARHGLALAGEQPQSGRPLPSSAPGRGQ